MTEKRIKTTTSRTAAMTCMSRAVSYLEGNIYYHSDDHLAVKILPTFIRVIFYVPLIRNLFVRLIAPVGIYEYVIARTKYIDAVFEKALDDQFDQILLFGAGYDTRALRFQNKAQHARIFELDEPHTQQAKIKQLRKRNLNIPSNLVFIAIDFEKELLPEKLDMAKFKKAQRTLFILEGLLMYLEPESVNKTFQIIREYGSPGNRLVFDYVQASVLRHENTLYGEEAIVKSVHKAGEPWRFGIDPDKIDSFAVAQGFTIVDNKCAHDLGITYFHDKDGRTVGRINGTHCIATMERQ